MPFKCCFNAWPPPLHIHGTCRFPEGEWQSYKDDNLWRESSAEMREKQRLEADMINDVRQAAEVHRQVRHVVSESEVSCGLHSTGWHPFEWLALPTCMVMCMCGNWSDPRLIEIEAVILQYVMQQVTHVRRSERRCVWLSVPSWPELSLPLLAVVCCARAGSVVHPQDCQARHPPDAAV